jgi:DNA-binding IclR family transcriptional regulator
MVAASDRSDVLDDHDRIHSKRGVRDRERVASGRLPEGVELRARPPRTAIQVLDRLIAVLSAVEGGARSFTDVVDVTGLPLSTANRLLQGMEEHGLVLQVGGLGYVLGPRLLGLATTALTELPLRELAHPILERLARSTGESAQLFVRDGDRRVCVDTAESQSELRTIVEIGASLPLTLGSAGKVFLAWAVGPERERIVASAEDPERLDRRLFTTRRRGWADSVAERAPGVASVSAPVFGPGRTVLAAVSVSGPAQRLGSLRAKRYATAVTDAARKIEATLGVSPVPPT